MNYWNSFRKIKKKQKNFLEPDAFSDKQYCEKILLFELECNFFKLTWIKVVVYNSKTFLENMTQPFLKILKGTFY